MSNKREIVKELHDPIIVIDNLEPNKLRYLMQLTSLDPFLSEPQVWGVVVSDLVSNIAAVYASCNGTNAKQVQELIMSVLLKENELKATDPGRGVDVVSGVLIIDKPKLSS